MTVGCIIMSLCAQNDVFFFHCVVQHFPFALVLSLCLIGVAIVLNLHVKQQ